MQGEAPTECQLVGSLEQRSQHIGERPSRPQPSRLFRRQDPVFRSLSVDGAPLDQPGHGNDEVTDRAQTGDHLAGQLHAQAVIQLERDLHPIERIDAEIEGQIGVEGERLVGTALLQQRPYLGGRRLGEERSIRFRKRRRTALRPLGQRPLIQLREQEAPILAEARARQRLLHDDKP